MGREELAMNGHAAKPMHDEPGRHQACAAEVARRLPIGYVSRSSMHNACRPRCSGKPLSSDVCQLAIHIAARAGCSRIVVLGWGAAEAFRSLPPEFELVVVDREDARSSLGWDLPRAAFITGDLEAGLPPLDRAALQGSLVVCLGVLEQLARPEILARDLARIRHHCAFLLVATPDRARLRGLLSGGPPVESDRVREWTADEFGRFLVDCGFPANPFFGHAAVSRDDHAKNVVLAIAGREAELSCSGRRLRVAAIINIFNEADVVEHVVRYVAGQGLEVHLVDNWSDDGTYEICRRLHAAGYCESVSRFPEQPTQSF
jgi:hypothetical protein